MIISIPIGTAMIILVALLMAGGGVVFMMFAFGRVSSSADRHIKERPATFNPSQEREGKGGEHGS